MKKILAGGAVLVAVGIFAATLTRAVWYPLDTGTQAPVGVIATSAPQARSLTPSVPASGPAENPSRLIIPSLSINANVQSVGVTKSGNVGIPSNFTDVAWYKYGTVPGQIGNAVIDGHVDNAIALPGVFKHLAQIKVGDDVYVQTVQGTKLHFVVTDAQAYPYKDVPMQKIFSMNDAQYLTLITCGGTWVQAVKSYDQRFVVYAKFIEVSPR
jgi:sortase A